MCCWVVLRQFTAMSFAGQTKHCGERKVASFLLAEALVMLWKHLGMALIAALAYALSQQVGGISTALPVLGVLALGAQRLLPSLQQIYYAWASIAGSQASLADTLALLDQPLPEEATAIQDRRRYSFQDEVCLEAVRFRYTRESPWVLRWSQFSN